MFQNTLYAARNLIENQAREFGILTDELKIKEIEEGKEPEEFFKGKFILNIYCIVCHFHELLMQFLKIFFRFGWF